MANTAKVANLQAAFTRLETFLSFPIQDDRDEAGVIQAFEFTFELAWKTLQALAEAEMLSVATPKAALRFALRAGFINADDEALWLQMLEDRNLTSHTYKAEFARIIFGRIQAQYLSLLRGLVERISTHDPGES